MTANNRILVAVLALVVASAGFYMLALKPKREEVSSLETQISQKQDELNQARALLATNEKARQGYRTAYASVVRLGKAVPADDDVRSLVVQLDAAAKAAGIDFRSIDVGGGAGGSASAASGAAATPLPPGATVGPAGFPVIPFSFAFTGSFFKLGDFFHRLQEFVKATNDRVTVNGRLLTLDSLQLQPDSAGFPRIRATVGATSYLVSPIEGPTAGATAQNPGGATTPAAGTGSTTATSTGAIR